MLVSENYTLKGEWPTPGGAYVRTIAIRLENMPDHSTNHEEMKSNLLKYITFQSAKRLSPGVYTTCENNGCKETIEITYDDIKIALASAFEFEKVKYEKRREELRVQMAEHDAEFEKTQKSYEACQKEIDEDIKQIPTKAAKKADLSDEIKILQDIIVKKKYELANLE